MESVQANDQNEASLTSWRKEPNDEKVAREETQGEMERLSEMAEQNIVFLPALTKPWTEQVYETAVTASDVDDDGDGRVLSKDGC